MNDQPENPFVFTTDTTRFQDQMRGASTTTRQFADEARRANQVGRQFGNAIGSAFEGLVLKGKSLGDTVRSLSQSLSSIAFRAAFKPLEQGIGNMLSGALSGGATLSPAAATNPLAALFSSSGSIGAPSSFPLESLAAGITTGAGAAVGSAPNVTFNVTATDAESFKRSEAQISSLLSRAVAQGQRSL